MKRIIATLTGAAALLCTGCASMDRSAPGDDQLMTLRSYLTGSFSSEQQSVDDPSYYHIALHMAPMWTWRDDGPWLYVEQSVAATPDRPYRQRVYKLERGEDGSYISRVFTFPEPLTHAGAWESGSPLSDLSPEDLEERVGCAITVTWEGTWYGGAFIGATSGNGCASSLNGSSYATSEVTLLADRLLTWDRGFDDAGEQVWGATAGGYIFDRVD